MKHLLLALLMVLQTPAVREDYPGQKDHGQPPDGWMCVHQNYELSVPLDHACNCERACDEETGKVVEDKQCKVWCHADHCSCDMSNKQACK